MNELTDILITTYNRPFLLKQTLASLFIHTDPTKTPFRVYVSVDEDFDSESPTVKVLRDFPVNQIVYGRTEAGLCDSLNRLIALTKRIKPKPDFICYLQDDVWLNPRWLETQIRVLKDLSKAPIGFVTGFDAPEHPPLGCWYVTRTVWKKRITRATQLLAKTELWYELTPIPKLNPNGSKRGRPHNGIGSRVDWWLMVDAPNSTWNRKLFVGVVPGLVEHLGEEMSTWR